MLNQQLALLYPLVGILVLMTVFVLYVYYTSARHFRIKLLLGPALLAACIVAVPAIGGRLGYAWPTTLPTSFQYIAHRTVIAGGEKRWIDVLLLSRRPLGTDARLHRIPWTSKVEEVLDQAGRMKEAPDGGDIVVSRQAGSSVGGGGDPGYSATRVLPRDRAPKAPIPPGPLRRQFPSEIVARSVAGRPLPIEGEPEVSRTGAAAPVTGQKTLLAGWTSRNFLKQAELTREEATRWDAMNRRARLTLWRPA